VVTGYTGTVHITSSGTPAPNGGDQQVAYGRLVLALKRIVKGHQFFGSNPKTATPFDMPTNTLPFTIVGVMNLLP